MGRASPTGGLAPCSASTVTPWRTAMSHSVSPATTTYVSAVGHDVSPGVAVAPRVAAAIGATVGAEVGPTAMVGAAVGPGGGDEPTALIPAAGADGLGVDAGRVEVALTHPTASTAVVRKVSQGKRPLGSGGPSLMIKSGVASSWGGVFPPPV